MKPKMNTTTQKHLPATGVNLFRCLGFVDLGTQKSKMYDPSPKIQAFFELTETSYVFDKEKGPQPETISREFGNSFGEKANLRKIMESWFGSAFTEEQVKKFNLKKWINLPGQLTVSHTKPNAQGIKYANIQGLMPIIKGTKVSPLRNKPFLFTMDSPNECYFGDMNTPITALECIDLIYPWLKKKIELSPEWEQLNSGRTVNAVALHGEEEEDPMLGSDEDSPF